MCYAEESKGAEAAAPALPVCLHHWLENPYRLVGLWHVLEIFAGELSSISPILTSVYLDWTSIDGPKREAVAPNVRPVINVCRKLGWQELAKQGERVLEKVSDVDENPEGVRALLSDFTEAIGEKVASLRVAVIEERDNSLFSDATKALCGASLHGDLAVCEEEFNLAGRSLAFGLSTAAVAHAMRSAEASLQMLCRTLGITFSGAVELQDWTNLTEKIKSTIAEQEKQPRSPEKSGRLKHLSELMIPADGFRLAWRNHVAHAREKYEEEESRKILGHVAKFLERLSSTL